MSDSRRMRRAVGQLAVRVGGHAVWVSALMCCVLLAGISIGETFIPLAARTQHVGKSSFRYPLSCRCTGCGDRLELPPDPSTGLSKLRRLSGCFRRSVAVVAAQCARRTLSTGDFCRSIYRCGADCAHGTGGWHHQYVFRGVYWRADGISVRCAIGDGRWR